MLTIEFFEDTINPLSPQTAKQFVYDHRNIFATKITRRLLPTDSMNLIVIKEITHLSEDEKTVWFWFFTPTFRGILEDHTHRLGNATAVEIIEKAIKERKQFFKVKP